MNWLRRNKHHIEDECCEERLSAYLDCELSPEERAAVERHLAQCENCRWDLDTLRQTVELTRNCAPVPLPRVFTIPVEVAAPQAVRTRRPAWALPVLQGATALVALLFVVVVVGDLFLGSTAPRGEPQMVALQATAVVSQVEVVKEVAVTQDVEMVAVAPTAVAEAAAELPRPEPAAAKAAPTAAPVPPPSAPEEPAIAALAPTAAAEVGGIGGGLPDVSVTMEILAVEAEPPSGVAKLVTTPTVTVTLAFTAAVPLLITQPLTVEVTTTGWTTAEHALARVPTPTAVPTRRMLATAAPAVETAAPAAAPMDTADIQAAQDATTMAGAEGERNAAAATEAPAALLAAPEPTAIAAAPQAREAEQGARAGEQQGAVGTLRETVAPWFSLAEIVLGAVFVLLALATAVVMLRWQPR